jgi:GNAT superfamily N-acetyltransferase
MPDDPRMQVLVAECSGLLGTGMLVIVPNLTQGARPYALIENVVTRANIRGQWVGTALMRAAVTHAQAQGV